MQLLIKVAYSTESRIPGFYLYFLIKLIYYCFKFFGFLKFSFLEEATINIETTCLLRDIVFISIETLSRNKYVELCRALNFKKNLIQKISTIFFGNKGFFWFKQKESLKLLNFRGSHLLYLSIKQI